MKFKFCILFTISVALVFINKNAHAQYVQDINGKPFEIKKYAEVSGSQFLADQFEKGTVKLNDGSTYKDVLLKYDLVNDELFFKDSKDQVLTFITPVSEFAITYINDNKQVIKYFKNGYTIENYNPRTFFEVLSNGTVQFLKKSVRYIQESKEYNSATINKKFIGTSKYYLIIGDKAVLIKRDKKFILNILADKQSQLETYISSNKLNLKNDDDLAKLINYYNSI